MSMTHILVMRPLTLVTNSLSLHMKFEFNWPSGFGENWFDILMGLMYENPWLKSKKFSLDLWNLFIAIVSLGLT